MNTTASPAPGLPRGPPPLVVWMSAGIGTGPLGEAEPEEREAQPEEGEAQPEERELKELEGWGAGP